MLCHLMLVLKSYLILCWRLWPLLFRIDFVARKRVAEKFRGLM